MKRLQSADVKSTKKTSRKKLNPDSGNVRFEEIIQTLQQEVKDKKSVAKTGKTEKDLEDFDTFESIDLKTHELFLYDHLLTADELNPVLDFSVVGHHELTRGVEASFPELVRQVFTTRLLDSLIEWNVAANSRNELPAVMYGNNDGMIYLLLNHC